MTSTQKLFNSFLAFIFLLSTTSQAGVDPLGQSANYKIDKDPKRTSSMLKSGTIKLSVPNEGKDQSMGPAYQVKIDYKFNVALMGDYEGTKETQIEKEYFTEEFLQELREKGHYDGQYFKADHVGYADATNMDGKFYPHCDKILLYDLKEPSNLNFFKDFLATVADPLFADREDIQDLKVLIHVFVGVPVLGAVKVDVSGIYQGMNVKAGGDYTAR
ncbi:hypothetical protein EBQ74_10575 [bacterium]|nr:hypothetical protein [bacterium]